MITPRKNIRGIISGVVVMLCVFALLAMTGCGGTNSVKPVKCEDRQIFQPADHHIAAYNAFMSIKIKAIQADIPDGGENIFVADISEFFAGGVK